MKIARQSLAYDRFVLHNSRRPAHDPYTQLRSEYYVIDANIGHLETFSEFGSVKDVFRKSRPASPSSSTDGARGDSGGRSNFIRARSLLVPTKPYSTFDQKLCLRRCFFRKLGDTNRM